MKSFKKLLVLPLFALSLSACNGNAEVVLNLKKYAPNYSRIKATINTFGYTPPTGGEYYEDGITISTGEDYRTPERYKEYKDCGMNILMLQSEDQYDHKPFEKSALKKRMDDAQTAGLERVIVCDDYLYQLCNTREPLIDPDKDYELTVSNTQKTIGGLHNFKSEQALIDYVGTLIAPYRNHPVFYGVIIRDEPYLCHLPNWCRVYKALSMACPNIYIEGNLLPYESSAGAYFRFTNTDISKEGQASQATDVPTKQEAIAAYRNYVESYLDWSGASRVMMDSYPFILSNNGRVHNIKASYLQGLQILGDICTERDIEFEGVSQSMGGKNNKNPTWQSPSTAALQWQMNTYLGLGCETFGYFTYWRKVWNQSNGEWFNDGESFISSNGTRTSIYYNVKSMHEEMQKAAPTMSCFKLKNTTCYVNGSSEIDNSYAYIDERDMTLFKQSDFKANQGSVAFITELRDSVTVGKNQYMYMVMNALDPYYKAIEENPNDDKTLMNFSIQFDAKKYNAVAVMYRGETYLYQLQNGLYKSTLDAGYAEYIMPFRAAE